VVFFLVLVQFCWTYPRSTRNDSETIRSRYRL